MPTYDYKCHACGHEFELFQQMSDPVKRKCPKCGKPKLERLIGIGAGVLFKGGGFYETDYRSDGYTKAAEAEKKAAEGKPEPAKTDAVKPAEKSDGGASKTETPSKAAATDTPSRKKTRAATGRSGKSRRKS